MDDTRYFRNKSEYKKKNIYFLLYFLESSCKKVLLIIKKKMLSLWFVTVYLLMAVSGCEGSSEVVNRNKKFTFNKNIKILIIFKLVLVNL